MNKNPQNLEQFGERYDEFFEKVYGFIFYRIQHKETAEDLTSQVFMKAVTHFHKFSADKASFSTWLLRIARNTLIDFFRTKKNYADLEKAFEVKSDEDLEEKVAVKMDFEKVREVLSLLKPDARDIVMMRLWDGLSYKEIAEITGKSEGALKMVFSRSVEKLQKQLLVVATILFILLTL